MERKIGSKFTHKGVTLKVVKQCGCKGCYFLGDGCLKTKEDEYHIGFCAPSDREGFKSLIFKRV